MYYLIIGRFIFNYKKLVLIIGIKSKIYCFIYIVLLGKWDNSSKKWLLQICKILQA